jgi:hypothetical protein
MAMFVIVRSGERVPMTIGENTIYILPKMDLGTRNRLMDELAHIEQASGSKTAPSMAFALGRYMTALAVTNIVAWEGPAFEGMLCTEANIRLLDPDEPLVDMALAEIGKRNPLASKNPKS